jgi:hypothetical protein
MFSAIERKLKNKPIYVPANYIDIFEGARMDKPYRVKYLTHDFFKNYSDLKYYNSIRPGYRVGDNGVLDIRALMYCPSGEIRYKLAMERNFLDLPRRANVAELTGADRVNNLHASSLPIKATEYRHLQELKSVIPRDYHHFFDGLPHY